MRKYISFFLASFIAVSVHAQQKAPKWMDKQKQAVVVITTYNKDNKELRKGTGFFVSETGELLSSYSVLKNADHAVVKDAKGKEYEVSRVIGADELYDVIRLRADVDKKVAFLVIADQKPTEGSTAYLMPFSEGKIKNFGSGKINDITKLKGDYSYYELSIPINHDCVNSPIMTEDGKVIGLAQEDASGNKERSFAVSAAYAHSLNIQAMDVLNSTYSDLGIRKAWPENAEQAQVMLMLLQGKQDAKTYLETLNDYIQTFPSNTDAYLSRASHYAYFRKELGANSLDMAMNDIRSYQDKVDDKSEGLYQEAKLMYGVASSDSLLNNGSWSVESAKAKLDEAISELDKPLYHQLKADIYVNEGNMQQAYDEYMIVNKSDIASPSTWYMAAKLREKMPNINIGEIINLLDSAIVAGESSPKPEIAPFVLERIDWKLKLTKYREAIADYDLYYQMMNGNVNDSFFYFREQAKFRANDLDGALADIKEAIKMAPDNATYLAEEASVLIRKEQYAEALASVDKALALAPDFAACHRLRGVSLIRQKKMDEAKVSLLKASELGDKVADRLLKDNY